MIKVDGTERRFRTLKRTDKSIIIFYRFLILKETAHLNEKMQDFIRDRRINANFIL